MQDLKVKEPMTRNYNTMFSPPQCFQRCKTQKGSKEQRPTQSKLKAKWKAQIDLILPESHHVYICDKKGNHSNACQELKGLVPVGNPSLVVGEDIADVSRDCVPYIYHPMFFQKIKNRFGLSSIRSEVSPLIPADISGPTVRSTNAGTHKIAGLTLRTKMLGENVRTLPEVRFFQSEN